MFVEASPFGDVIRGKLNAWPYCVGVNYRVV